MQTSYQPVYNPILSSDCYESSQKMEFSVPTSEKKIALHLYVEKGPVEIFFNSWTNTPSLKLYESAKWNVRFYDGSLQKVFLRPIKKDYKVWAIVEHL